MCGRFTLIKPEKIKKRFNLKSDLPLFQLSYNIAPGHKIPIITKNGTIKAALVNWGFIPDWADEQRTKIRPINTRADSLLKPFYKDAFQHNRCLVPASGFFEWKSFEIDGKHDKQPYYFKAKNEDILAFAGIYGEKGFSIITTKPNSVVAKIHHRMPLILDKSTEEKWLTSKDLNDLLSIAQMNDLVPLEFYRIPKYVNDPKNSSPEIIKPL